MTQKVWVSLALSVAMLGTGLSVAAWLIHNRPPPETKESDSTILSVQYLRLVPETLVERIVGYGTAEADRSGWIMAEVAGTVIEVSPSLKSGTDVAAGEILLRIDPRDAQAQVDRARSQLDADKALFEQLGTENENLDALIAIAKSEFSVAQREYDRVRDLLERGNSNVREIDQFRMAFERSRLSLQTFENQKAVMPQRIAQQRATCDLRRSDLALAELSLERCTIVAPFPGRIDIVRVELGERVSPGMQLLSVLDPENIDVAIELPVSLRERISIGAPCTLMLESAAATKWSGRVERIAPRADAATRSFSLFVEVRNAEQVTPLVPGTFVRAEVAGSTLSDVLLVDRGSIQRGRVFVYENGAARQRDVSVEWNLIDRSVVRGLSPGELVITSNLDVLFDGAPVRLYDSAPPGEL